MQIKKDFIVLAYHGVYDSVNFEKQLKYLRSHYNILDGNVFFESHRNSNANRKKNVLITFDDGDKSLYKKALPILKKYKIPAIIFVVTELIDTDKPFWWDEIKYYQGEKEGIKRVRKIKKWKNRERKNYLNQLFQDSKKLPLRYPQLTTGELKEMKGSGITIANHSHTHPMFNQCTEEELEEELSKSITRLKSLNFTPEAFAYPNGNYSKVAEQKLKEHGIKLVFLFDHKINKGKINPLRISRLAVNDDTPLWKFKLILSGWHSKILPLTKALGKLRR